MKQIILLTTLLGVLIFMNSCVKSIDPVDEGGVVTEITKNTTWAKENVYIVEGTLSIDGVTLTIEPGTIVKFKEGAEINVGNSEEGSALIANGTPDKPIIFTSYATTPTKGDWDGLFFYSGTASTTSMKHCIVEYAGGYSSYGSINMNGCEITIENSIIRDSETWGITLNSSASFKSFIGNNINNAENHVISLYPNAVHTIGINNSLNPIASNLGIFVKSGTYDQTDETWLMQTAPYVIDGTLSIKRNAGSILRIQEGSTLAFTNGAEINVAYNEYGTLIAKGTLEKPITFTSASNSPDQGDWDGVYIYDGANNCEFEFCNFEYGGGYSPYGMININNTDVSFKNCSFENSKTWGISLNSDAYFNTFENNTFSDNYDYQISIYGNYAHTIGTGNAFGDPLGIYVKGDDLEQSGTVTWLKHDAPYYMQGTLHIGSTAGTTLNIEAGAILKFTNGAEFNIGYSDAGKLVANGTITNPITFTTANISSAQGDWDGLYFYSNTMGGSVLNYCNVSYGGGYSPYGMIHISECGNEVSISNSSITDSKTWGIAKGSSTAIPSLTNILYNNNLNGNINW